MIKIKAIYVVDKNDKKQSIECDNITFDSIEKAAPFKAEIMSNYQAEQVLFTYTDYE